MTDIIKVYWTCCSLRGEGPVCVETAEKNKEKEMTASQKQSERPAPCPWCKTIPVVAHGKVKCVNPACPVRPRIINWYQPQDVAQGIAEWNTCAGSVTAKERLEAQGLDAEGLMRDLKNDDLELARQAIIEAEGL